jgi:plasmid stability protein
MGDLLIRNIDPEVKKRLGDSAHSHGRTVSEEAEDRLRRSFLSEKSEPVPAGQRLRALIEGFALTDQERADIAESRKERDRAPPSFEAMR